MDNHFYRETDKYVIMSPKLLHSEMICQYMQRNREHLAPWEPIRQNEYFTVEGWDVRIEQAQKTIADGTFLPCIVIDKVNNSVIAFVNINSIAGFPFHGCTMGYSVDKEYEGKGILTETIPYIMDYLFLERKLHRISAGYMPRNKRSEKLLTRLGFEREGYGKSYLLIAGVWEDHILMSKLNPHE